MMVRPDPGSLSYMTRRAKTFAKQSWKEQRRHIVRQRRRAFFDLPVLFELLVLLQGRKCAACGRRHGLTIDHILPVSRGGRTEIDNLQILCRRCNERKAAEIMDFREG